VIPFVWSRETSQLICGSTVLDVLSCHDFCILLLPEAGILAASPVLLCLQVILPFEATSYLSYIPIMALLIVLLSIPNSVAFLSRVSLIPNIPCHVVNNVSSSLKYSPTSPCLKTTIAVGSSFLASAVLLAVTPNPNGVSSILQTTTP
jgi:hypothetical protein